MDGMDGLAPGEAVEITESAGGDWEVRSMAYCPLPGRVSRAS